MKVFLSVFKSEKCTSCNIAFNITMKRRECKLCSNLYPGKLFCTSCSTKIRRPNSLLYDRYCLSCHSSLTRPKTMQLTAKVGISPHDPRLSHPDYSKSFVDPHSHAHFQDDAEETKVPARKATLLGAIKQRVSKLIVIYT